jgi:hypothetical protein
VGPFTVEAELWYQPIGYRWANNLRRYGNAAEPHRFNNYFDSMKANTATVLARVTLNTDLNSDKRGMAPKSARQLVYRKLTPNVNEAL